MVERLERRRLAVGVPLACLFLSGASALIYEVIWSRLLFQVFGSTVHATSTVFGVFFTGLAVGSLVFGALIDRVRRPLLFYAGLETALGLYALLTPNLVRVIEALDLRWSSPAHPSASLAARVGLSFALLFVPAVLMGGTFPAVCRHFIRRRSEAGHEIGRLYAVNTFGAVAGTFLAGFFFIEALGLSGSLRVGALLNFVAALASGWIATPGASADLRPTPSVPVAGARDRNALLWVLFVSGFTSLIYEVTWTRSLNFFFGSSVYSLAIMLAAFLLGLVVGSLVYAVWIDRKPFGLEFLGMLQLRIAFSVVLFLAVLMTLPELYVLLVRNFGSGFFSFQAAQWAVIFLVMLYTTVSYGIAFPAASRLFLESSGRTGRASGLLYAVNTAGALLGAFAAGFVLIGAIGVDRTIMAAVLVNVATAAFLLFRARAPRGPALVKVSLGVVLAFLIPFWWRSNRDLLTTGVYAMAYQYRPAGAPERPATGAPTTGATTPGSAPIPSRAPVYPPPNPAAPPGMEPLTARRDELVFYRDGRCATVAVYRDSAGERTLLINGKPDASTVRSGDMRTQLLLAHLPALFSTAPKQRALVIGLGSATTLGSLSLYPFQRLDAVEIEPAVVEAASFFRDANLDVLRDPRVHVQVEDARRFIRWTHDRYDIITSEPSNLWMAGVANLFTREFFLAANDRLNPGGVFCQWIHLYQIARPDVQCFFRTFHAAFPECAVFVDGPDLLVLGSSRRLPTLDEVTARTVPPDVIKDLGRGMFSGLDDLRPLYVGGSDAVERFAGPGNVNTEDRPVLEFTAARNITADHSAEIVRDLRAAARAAATPPVRPGPGGAP